MGLRSRHKENSEDLGRHVYIRGSRGGEKGKYDSLKERDPHGVSQHLVRRGEEEDGCSV